MTQRGAPLLGVADLAVRFGRRLVVDHVGLDLHGGELTLLVGPNGAGKTTLVRAMAGLIASEGRISVGGRPLADLSAGERALRIAYLPQGHVFHWPMAVADLVALGRHPHTDPFTGSDKNAAAAVRRALAATGIEALAERSVMTLSGGERARVSLARALATEAPILLADEPTAALDPRHQLLVMELLRRAAREGGAVLAIVHDLTLAARFADRVLVMQGGRLVADGAPAEALSAARVADVFGIETLSVETADGALLIPRRPF